MLRGSLLRKVKSRRAKERLYRLQEDGMTVWFERRFRRAPSKQICRCWRWGGRPQGLGTPGWVLPASNCGERQGGGQSPSPRGCGWEPGSGPQLSPPLLELALPPAMDQCLPVHPIPPSASQCLPVHRNAFQCVPVHPVYPIASQCTHCLPGHPITSPCIPVHPLVTQCTRYIPLPLSASHHIPVHPVSSTAPIAFHCPQCLPVPPSRAPRAHSLCSPPRDWRRDLAPSRPGSVPAPWRHPALSTLTGTSAQCWHCCETAPSPRWRHHPHPRRGQWPGPAGPRLAWD